jgi:hypothetical protein
MRTSSRYLSFALDVRKLTDSLIALVEDGKPVQQLESSIREMVASLDTTGGKTSVRNLKERGSFARYEDVVVMNEVFQAPAKAELMSQLEEVLTTQSPSQREASALRAIESFDALERRALYHYNHPSSSARAVAHR